MHARARSHLASLRTSVTGEILTSVDRGFTAAHLGFNLAEQHRPDVVVRAMNAHDVATAVKFGADHGLQVRVQSTGHGIGIPMTGGVLVNTSGMSSLIIDPDQHRATAAAGVRWQEAISAAGAHGFSTLCGSSPTVGIAGYTVGGGMGPMARTFGFAADHVRRMQLVDATGEILEIDPEREPELFWALRGGKPDVGIITQLEFDLMEVPTYYGGSIFYAGADAAAVLHEFARWVPGLPESVSTSIALLRMPDLPEIPALLRGTLTVHLRYVHIGDPEEGTTLLAPMRAVSRPVIDLVTVTAAAAIASVHQDPTDPMPARDEGMVLRDFPAAAVDALLTVAGPGVQTPLILAEVRLMGGALARPAAHESAIGGRDGAFHVTVIGPYPPALAAAVDAASAMVLAALQPWATGGSLINFQGSATAPDRVRSAWPVNIRDRLDRLKQDRDPDGVFCFAYSAIT